MEIKATNIHKAFGSVPVLEEISFTLSRGMKVGLVGGNGVGKSTLLKIIAGELETDAGQVTFRKGLVVGYLPQDTSLTTEETIEDYLRRISGIANLENKMGESNEAIDEYERRDGYSFHARMNKILSGFGLGKIDTLRSVDTLSSGQKSKVFMAGVLLQDADTLLLDEPTNNLDLPSLIWLENFLEKSKFACIIVSHDRLFLDRVVSKIFEINWQTRTLNISRGNYSNYIRRVRKEHERLFAQYKSQQKEVSRLTDAAQAKKQDAHRGSQFRGSDNDKYLRGFKRDRSKGSAKAAKALESRISKISRVEKPIDRDTFHILINPKKRKGSQVITLKEVVAGYPDGDFHIGPISLDIPYGSRVAVLGLNGTGKSTLLKTIHCKLPVLEGEIELGSALVIGNLMQEHDNLPREISIRTFLGDRSELSESEIFALAKKFGFTPTDIDKRISNLSPGGRSRLLFALFSALSVNVLLLDEPTNHLDLEALDALSEVVKSYQGTIILVSHDRYFLREFNPTETFVLSERQLKKQRSFDTYLAIAEREARHLAEML